MLLLRGRGGFSDSPARLEETRGRGAPFMMLLAARRSWRDISHKIVYYLLEQPTVGKSHGSFAM
jgi:hypothetical protein